MEAIEHAVMYFVSFGAISVMFGSLIGMALWLAQQAWQLVYRPLRLR
jgi:hypothetical protein